MTETLEPIDLGPLSLLAPAEPPRRIDGTHGRMWQWTGDGRELMTLAVAVRETRLGTGRGVRDHLTWETGQLQPGPPQGQEEPVVEDVAILVPGATAAACADVVGAVAGNRIRHRIVVSTDGASLHVLRMVVPDNAAGTEVADRVSASLQVPAVGKQT